jgi:hypothetical protein
MLLENELSKRFAVYTASGPIPPEAYPLTQESAIRTLQTLALNTYDIVNRKIYTDVAMLNHYLQTISLVN